MLSTSLKNLIDPFEFFEAPCKISEQVIDETHSYSIFVKVPLIFH
jgi:hypothetical protein